MNMRLLLPLIAALAFTPLVATHHGFGPNLRVGSALTSWPSHATEQGIRFECVAAGADLVRRAAPPVIGGTARPNGSIALKPPDPVVCANS
jgi:hypothetical protein